MDRDYERLKYMSLFKRQPYICPVCRSKNYHVCEYTEDVWGANLTVEKHNHCPDCGYFEEMAYSDVIKGFGDTKRGHRDSNGDYHEKNIKKHRRNRRKHLELVKHINREYAKYYRIWELL